MGRSDYERNHRDSIYWNSDCEGRALGACAVGGLLLLLLGAGQARAATTSIPPGAAPSTGGAEGWSR